MLTTSVSQRLTILRFPLIVGVVFVHAYANTISLQGATTGTDHLGFADAFVRNFVSKAVAQIAVPLFFLMSGFLFYQGYDGTLPIYKQKIWRRFWTLFVPFLIWNCATLLFYATGEALPSTRVYFAARYWPLVHSFSFLDYANAIFGLTTKYTISYQFWFIRDLIALILLAPIIYAVCRRRASATLLLLLLLGVWMSGTWPFLWPADQAMFFFVAGAILSIHKINVCALDRWSVPFGICSLALAIVVAWTGDYRYIVKSMILVTIPFSWWLAGVAASRPKIMTRLAALAAASFFIYAAHEPFLSMLRKVVFKLLRVHTAAVDLALYFAIPIAVISFLVMIHTLLVRYAPRFTAIITGSDRHTAASSSSGVMPVGFRPASGHGNSDTKSIGQ